MNWSDAYFDEIQIRFPPNWVSTDMSQDTIPPGDSSIVNVSFSSCPLNAGMYTGAILLQSNDPINPGIVPYSLSVVGDPEIALSESCLYLDSIMAYSTHTDSFYIYNTGCDTLFINDMNTILSEYTLNDTSFYVLPGDTRLVVVTFSPIVAGSYFDNIVILNNDSNLSVCLSGYSYPAPVISTAPVSLDTTITDCCDSITMPLAIYNTGGADLIYQISDNFYEDFENGLGNWVFTGTWALSSDSYEGANALAENASGNYSNSMNQNIEMEKSLLVTDAASCILTYMAKRDLENSYDYFYTRISVNNGHPAMKN